MSVTHACFVLGYSISLVIAVLPQLQNQLKKDFTDF